MEEQMTWRHIFDTNHRYWGHIKVALEAASNCGYKFMCWNGHILETVNGADTGIKVEDVK
jgi:hypothetical protein